MRVETRKPIDTWYGVATGTSIKEGDLHNTYFRFMALWVSSNAPYNSRFGRAGQDRQQIDAFAETDQAKTRHHELLQGNVGYREAVDCLRGYWAQRIRDEEDLSQVSSAVRKVRNNLFHGKKLPGKLEDESLVKASYVIVSKLMLVEPFLNEA